MGKRLSAAPDPHDLARFVAAQDPVWDDVRAELAGGRKRSHWMWFVFPQIEGLSSSAVGRRYAIRSRAEAGAYLAHPVLAARLAEAVKLLMATGRTDARAILGSPDDAKLRSSLTLFEGVAEGDTAALLAGALERFYGGQRCPHTRDWLDAAR